MDEERTCCRCGTLFAATYRRLLCAECKGKAKPATDLTFRQRQIVTMIRNDAVSNKEIAFRLKLSEGTVKEYLHQIFGKLSVSNRLELMRWGYGHLDQLGPLPTAPSAVPE